MYKHGQIVKLKVNGKLYKVEGYKVLTERIGTLHVNRKEYFLKDIETQEVIKRSQEFLEITDINLIDFLLDEYNKYKLLESIFQDNEYKEKMDDIVKMLKKEAP